MGMTRSQVWSSAGLESNPPRVAVGLLPHSDELWQAICICLLINLDCSKKPHINQPTYSQDCQTTAMDLGLFKVSLIVVSIRGRCQTNVCAGPYDYNWYTCMCTTCVCTLKNIHVRSKIVIHVLRLGYNSLTKQTEIHYARARTHAHTRERGRVQKKTIMVFRVGPLSPPTSCISLARPGIGQAFPMHSQPLVNTCNGLSGKSIFTEVVVGLYARRTSAVQGERIKATTVALWRTI